MITHFEVALDGLVGFHEVGHVGREEVDFVLNLDHLEIAELITVLRLSKSRYGVATFDLEPAIWLAAGNRLFFWTVGLLLLGFVGVGTGAVGVLEDEAGVLGQEVLEMRGFGLGTGQV